MKAAVIEFFHQLTDYKVIKDVMDLEDRLNKKQPISITNIKDINHHNFILFSTSMKLYYQQILWLISASGLLLYWNALF